MNFKIDGEFVYIEEVNPCKGLFYRGYNQVYYHERNVHHKQGVRFLKRKSCQGCVKCGFILDSMGEMIPGVNPFPKDVKDGALYSVRITNESRDWETGYIDDYDLEFYIVE